MEFVQRVIIYAATRGAGELSIPFVISTSILLLSLGSALLPFGFISLEPVLSLLTSPENESRVGAFHDGIAHIVPVNDLSWNGLRSHRRHGLPVRSSARSPALMAPVFAFGPSLCAGTGFVLAAGAFLVSSFERSIVPSGLSSMLVYT